MREGRHIQAPCFSGKLWLTKSPFSKNGLEHFHLGWFVFYQESTRAEGAFTASEVARRWQMQRSRHLFMHAKSTSPGRQQRVARLAPTAALAGFALWAVRSLQILNWLPAPSLYPHRPRFSRG
jgi:cytochrome b